MRLKKIFLGTLGIALPIVAIPTVIACSTKTKSIEEINELIQNNQITVNLNNVTEEYNDLMPSEITKEILVQNLKGISQEEISNLQIYLQNQTDETGTLEVIFEKNEIKSQILKLSKFKTKTLNLNFAIKTQKDQFILTNDYYSGQINQVNNQKINNYVLLKNNYNSEADSIMMGKGDALVLVFDNIDDSKENMKNFINSLYFIDTSVLSQLQNLQINNISIKKIDDIFGVKFNTKSLSSSYFGSQTNHFLPNAKIQEKLKNIEESFINFPKIFNNILELWGFKKDLDGNFSKDETIENQVSNFFYPNELITKELWKINQVAANAFSFTFNSNIESITYANITKEEKGKFIRLTPHLSLGKPIEWNSYLKNGNNNVLGQKIKSYVNFSNVDNIEKFNNNVLESFNDIIFNNLKTINVGSSNILDLKSLNFIKNYLEINQNALVVIVDNKFLVRIKNISNDTIVQNTFKDTFSENKTSLYSWFINGTNHPKFGYFMTDIINNDVEITPNFDKDKTFLSLYHNNESASSGISSLKINTEDIIQVVIAKG